MTARVYPSAPSTTNSLLDRRTASPSLPAATAASTTAHTTTVSSANMSFYGGLNPDNDNASEAVLARRRHVSRNLFGVQLQTGATAQFARNKLREMLERESVRWNFDFETEKPLPGRFRWEPVGDPVRSPPPPILKPDVVTPPNFQELSATGPTQPKQRRLDPATVESLHQSKTIQVVSSASVPPLAPGLATVPLRRKFPTATATAPGDNNSPQKPLFPATTTTTIGKGSTAGGEATPPPSPPSLTAMIPATVLVTATTVDPLNDAARKYLSTDSSRRKEKQMKITMYSAVTKRRIGHGTAGAEKKAAF